jgi:hypothetical protein
MFKSCLETNKILIERLINLWITGGLTVLQKIVYITSGLLYNWSMFKFLISFMILFSLNIFLFIK